MWLKQEEPVRWSNACEPAGRPTLDDDGETLLAEAESTADRSSMGFFMVSKACESVECAASK
jgi:hypothetical protein